MAERILANFRKFSLEGYFDGWGPDCYLLYRPGNYADYKAFMALNQEDKSDSEALDFMIGLVKSHCLSGKVLSLVDDKLQLTDFRTDDLDSFDPVLIKDIFLALVGKAADPKATQSAALADAGQQSAGLTSATPSAEESTAVAVPIDNYLPQFPQTS